MSEEESVEEPLERNDSAKPVNDDPEPYQDENKMEDIFPWQAKFNELSRAAVGSKSMKMLENLLIVYVQKVSKTVHDCYTKPNRAGKLMKCMSDAFVFFHLFYQDIKDSFENSTYLEKMTELMAMYLNIEIKASTRQKEHVKTVVCRLTSALFIFLDHSENHILDVIIRAKYINKNHRKICSPILGKLLTSLRVYPMNDTLYVRFLLVFKLWKKVAADTEECKSINKIAIQILPAPSNFVERYKLFKNVLPRVPNSMNVTTFYMQTKFDLKTACQAFMKISKDPQQPIISEKPIFFEGRLAGSQSSLSGKITSFECGISRNLMNDIWSIAEPASTQKKGDGKGDEASKKNTKDKPNKNSKKKTKDWFDKEKRKNKNKGVVIGSFKENKLPTDVVPQSESVCNSLPAKEPATRESVAEVYANIMTADVTAVLTAEVKPNIVPAEIKQAFAETTPAPVVRSSTPKEVLVNSCVSFFRELSFESQALPAETRPSVNLLTPQVKPEVVAVPSPPPEDIKPLALLDIPHALPIEIPRIHLSQTIVDVKSEPLGDRECGVSCELSNSNVVCSNFISCQREEESTMKLTPERVVMDEPDSSVVSHIMEVTETIKPQSLDELVEVKSLSKEVVSPVVPAEFLYVEEDVLNEVTIATSELNISFGGNNGKLPIYLQCEKEVVVETAEQPSPVGSVDSSRIEEENLPAVAETQAVIIPSSSVAQPKSCCIPHSHSPEVEQLGTEQHPTNRDNLKFVISSPLEIIREQPAYMEPPREVVTPEMGPPLPDVLNFSKETPGMNDEDWNAQPFGLFQYGNSSDILFEDISMECSYESEPPMDLVVNPISPCVIDSQLLEVEQDSSPSLVKHHALEEYAQYSQMCLESNMHRPQVENMLPAQEFFPKEFPSFAAAPDQYSYYNARDLYGNYNPNPFFEEPVSQTPRGSLNQKSASTTGSAVENDGALFGTVDYSSSNLNSAHNSIVLTCDKDSVIQHSRGIRAPSNSDNNYYRETDSPKIQDEQALGKTEEPVVNSNSSPKHFNSYTPPVVDDRHLLQKGVTINPNGKTPHPVSVLQDNRKNAGCDANSGDNSTMLDCKVQLFLLGSEEAMPIPKPSFREGMFLSGSGRPIRPTCYYSLGVPVSIPVAIPFPPQTLHQKTCCCDDCFESAKNYLFPMAAGVPSKLVLDLHTSGLKKQADELKHQDDQLLKTIEDSMKDLTRKENPQLLDSEISRMESLSTLPLKKRHKIGSDTRESAFPEGFPNGGVTPMISIPSLQPGDSNSTRPLQEVNINQNDDSSSEKSVATAAPKVELNQLPQSSSMCTIQPAHSLVTSTSTCSSQDVDEAEINSRKRDEIIANYWEKRGREGVGKGGRKKPKTEDMIRDPGDMKDPDASYHHYKPTQSSRNYPAPTKASATNVNYGEQSDNNRRPVKTAAQLKEMSYSRDLHFCFSHCPRVTAIGNWQQNGTESMILHQESCVSQPQPGYRMADTPKPAPPPENKPGPKKSTTYRKRRSISTKRTRSSRSRKDQSGSETSDSLEPKQKRKHSTK